MDAIKQTMKEFLAECAEHTEVIREAYLSDPQTTEEKAEVVATIAKRGLALAKAFDGLMVLGTIGAMLDGASDAPFVDVEAIEAIPTEMSNAATAPLPS